MVAVSARGATEISFGNAGKGLQKPHDIERELYWVFVNRADIEIPHRIFGYHNFWITDALIGESSSELQFGLSFGIDDEKQATRA